MEMSCYHDDPLIPPEAFQELVQERTQERKNKLQKRRRDGLRRIAEMKSKSGVHPLNLFPKEIWLRILNEGNPEDKMNASQVHPMFHSLMECHRIRDILFPQAIKVILEHVNKNDETHDRIFKPDISRYKISKFIKLRQVSKSINLAFASWFQEKHEEELHECIPNTYIDSQFHGAPPMLFHMCRNYDKIIRLIENYSTSSGTSSTANDNDPTPANALIVKSITVKITPPNGTFFDRFEAEGDDFYRNGLELFKSAVIKVLQIDGNQVLCFELNVTHLYFLIEDHGVTVADFYLLLQECCQLMPNLRKLDVSLEACRDVSGNEAPRNLTNLINAHTFPTLEKLERFGWIQNDGKITVTPNIVDAIIRANPHVKMLKLDNEGFSIEELARRPFKALQLDYFTYCGYDMSSQVPSQIINPRWPWSLKFLDFQTDMFSNLKDLFKFVMKFPTLQKIYFVVPDIGRGLEFLDLPNLEEFGCQFRGKIDYERDDVNFFFSLHFLLYAKKLKCIDWDCHLGEEGEALKEYLEKHECPEKMLDFRSGLRDVKSSNVWNAFPELETVMARVPKVRNNQYEWEGYHEHQLFNRPCKMLL